MAEEDVKNASESDTESHGDNFEDAPDSTPRLPAPPSPKSPHGMPASVMEGGPSSATSTPRGSKSISPLDAIVPEPNEDATAEGGTTTSPEALPKSPLLTAHSPSTSSSDHPRLDDIADTTSTTSASDIRNGDEKLPEGNPPTVQMKMPPKTRGLSGNLPSMPWGSSTTAKANPVTPSSTDPIPKKLGMSFSWLSRGRSGNKETPTTVNTSSRSPSNKDRRDTITSINSISSNPELMLKKLEEGDDSDGSAAALDPKKKHQLDTLRERFKMLRLREEAGMKIGDEQEPSSPGGGGALAALIGRGASVGLGIGSPISIADEKEGGLAVSPLQSPVTTAPPAPLAATATAVLPPGTASGASAGPSAMADLAAPVDWDLWQNVVYEGPSAVARTSPEELSRAIASGIPSAIRGVVWQVLAQSKNEELESVYKELVVRGTDKDREHQAALSGQLPQPAYLNGNAKEKQSVASSASSVHSDHSTPATTATNGLTSPSPSIEKDHENILKQQAAVVAERKQKAKEDAVSLSKLEKVIKRDLGARTSYSKYAAAAGLQEGLFGVCKAYALFDEGVGYAQGMNFLVMPLLFNASYLSLSPRPMPEEEAFCLLVRMMNQYHLREMFIQDMPGLHLHLYQFERLLEDLEPALYCHLHRRNVDPQLYATQWFLTLFAYRLPLQLVLRIYDLILSEGLEGAILKFGIVLMQKNAETLLGMNDMLTLTTFLKDKLFDVYIDQAPSTNSLLDSGFFGSAGGIDKEVYRADLLVQDACAVKITPQSLKIYTTEWEEKQRTEKERETEIETLRLTNANLAAKVRSLEQRTEKSDTEHVEMASELVRTKVENQELMDSMESLKGQSEELRTLIERQPEEVEQRLKAEMDRIMQRNVEVQNENRGLEEQMAEMEKELVQTKMSYAEINAEHESLKQKWLELRKAIGT